MIISDPTLVDLTSIFFVLCTNLKVYFIIHSGCSLAWIFMKERIKSLHDKSSKMTCAEIEDSDQALYRPSQIRVFAMHPIRNQVLAVCSCRTQGLVKLNNMPSQLIKLK